MPPPEPSAPVLLLGPLLRHVDDRSATVWVETDRPCEVEVLGHRARTFTVGRHCYALVVVEGLEPGSSIPYEVRLDGERVWPEPSSPFPPSRIRTLGRPGPFRVAFGSCRYAAPSTVPARKGIPPDALDGYAAGLVRLPEDEWPDALLLLGDQVYADELTAATRARLARHRSSGAGRVRQVADYEEYTRLYDESWREPRVRWLLSTIPSSMIFDDHEVIDDWNTSAAWRRRVTAEDWWARRIGGALASYWVYQHLGNLSPRELAEDPTWQAVQAAEGDAGPALSAMAAIADAEPRRVRWSYVRSWGPARLVMVDSRAGRVLDEESGRRMLDDDEFGWVEAALRDAVADGVDHLVLGTSLPWLLPHAVDVVERWSETLNRRHLGRPLGRLSEQVRQLTDLEHWSAFGDSFARFSRALLDVARGAHGPAPATVLVLSGDVHHAYSAEVTHPADLAARVHQLTVSPLHNQAPHPLRAGFRIGWSRRARRLTERLARWCGVPLPDLEWTKVAGPYFGNQLGELVLSGREARFRLFVTGGAGPDRLHPVLDLPLSTTVAEQVTG